MKILVVEPYLAGSHSAWAREYAAASSHEVGILGLPGRHWKWRMHGGAVTLARRFVEEAHAPDLILATDMLDLSTFLALTRRAAPGVPAAVYFHENQLSYPWSSQDADPGLGRDAHYGFINYASALASDAVLFNSDYHRSSFLEALPGFLEGFPDNNERGGVDTIAAKSSVLPLGVDLARLDRHRTGREEGAPPLILWNHRWEYDKNPGGFIRALFALAGEGLAFEVALLGESFGRYPPVFDEARERLGERIVRFGYVEDFAEYASWLWRADILPVTSDHDFFGASAVQAIYCGCRPLLPRRLAFPEHIPEGLQGECLYDDFDDLVGRLRALLREPRTPAPAGLRAHVARYDWGGQVVRYDALLAGIRAGQEGQP
jgi:glycosyltransferase involved in cell wall biosynthesis